MNTRIWMTAAAAVGLVACGGGSDHDPAYLAGLTPVDAGTPAAPAPTPPFPVAPEPTLPVVDDKISSAACFNAADLNEGTIRETETRATHAGGEVTYFYQTRITGPREPFAGANPVVLRSQGLGFENLAYQDLVDGILIRYGTSTVYANGAPTTTTTDTPPTGYPIAMQPGQKVSLSSVAVHTSNGNPTSEFKNTEERLYEGRERVQFVLGTFDACKFTEIATIDNGGGVIVVETVRWTAAEGPYRGQDLKFQTKTPDGNGDSIYEITRMVYSPK